MEKAKPQNMPTIQKGLDYAWWIWFGLMGLVLVYLAGVFMLGGGDTLKRCIQTQPLEMVGQASVCAVLVWLTFGFALMLLRHPNVRMRHGVPIICSVILLLLYINFLRERFHYGDVRDYVQAAVNLYNHEPFHQRYLYPPLLATLCQPFLWLGIGECVLAGIFWGGNWVGLVLFFILLVKTLKTYGFGHHIANYAGFAFLLVNVAVLRTLCYVQVNFHMMNLILLSFLIYPRNKLLSAVALALAVHLKASPIILVLPFLYARDVKWLIRFALSIIVLFAMTYCFYGWMPYASFFENSKNIYAANGITFRECSIDAVVRTISVCLRTNGKSWAVLLVKIPVLLGLLWGAYYTIKQKTWERRDDVLGSVLNALPLLLFVMVFASPLVWEHHFIFLSLPVFLLLKKMQTALEWVMYGFAYLFIFLSPTFDFFPFSFCRLIGAGLLFYLCMKVAKYPNTHWFTSISQHLEQSISRSPPCFNG